MGGPRARHNLPAEVTSLVGRTGEIADVRALLGRARLVTLLGPGGVGKSRIARAAGARLVRAFPDGVWLVDLSVVRDAEFVERAVQDTLPGHEGIRSLTERLRERRVLVVLDDCDRHHEAVADLAAVLLARCPGVRLLATSRVPLGISAEHVVPVAPLGTEPPPGGGDPDAVALFRERAAAGGGWDCAAVPPDDLARLCARLDGLPLAIELAALRTRSLTVAELEAGLADRFELLRGGPRDLHPRHRSLWTLLEWTWDNCTPEERSVWAQASVFAGPVGRATIRDVCRLDGAHVGDAIDGLVRQCVLLPGGGHQRARFDMYATFREFGLVKLADEGDTLVGAPRPEQVRARHLAHFTAAARTAERAWFGPDQAGWSAVVSQDMANLRVAFDRAMESDPAAGVELFATLWFRWVGCGRLAEGMVWAARVEAEGGWALMTPAAAWPMGWIRLLAGDLPAAEKLLSWCVAESTGAADRRAAGFGRALLVALRYFTGDVAGGVAAYREVIADAEARGDWLSYAVFSYQLGEAYCMEDDLELADAVCTASLETCRRHGDRWCAAFALWVRALVAFRREDDPACLALAAEARDAAASVDDHLCLALVAEVAAWSVARRGGSAGAATVLGATGSYWSANAATLMGWSRLLEPHAECRERLRAGLSGAELAAATAEGARLGVVAALDLALGRPGPEQAAAAPAGPDRAPELTGRELEIAELVAAGLTNREIAARLVIGKRTVDTHVAHVLAKWGLRRRAEIGTRLARRPDER
jgi:predicted ATPase/DNA-binding CsgD family transcriptional regulator